MNITTKVTKRDVLLLISLAIFLVTAAVIWFVIRPIESAIGDKRAEIEALRSMRDQYRISSEMLSTYESSLAEAKDKYLARQDAILPDGASEEVEKRLTETILGHGVEIKNFRISRGESYVVLKPYVNSVLAESVDAKELPGIYSFSVVTEVYGNIDQLQALIDLWAGDTGYTGEQIAYPRLFLESFTWRDSSKVDADGKPMSTLTLGVRVFLLEEAVIAVPLENG